MNIFINQSLPGGHFKRGVSPDPRVATVEKKEPINDLTLFRLNKTISCMYTKSWTTFATYFGIIQIHGGQFLRIVSFVLIRGDVISLIRRFSVSFRKLSLSKFVLWRMLIPEKGLSTNISEIEPLRNSSDDFKVYWCRILYIYTTYVVLAFVFLWHSYLMYFCSIWNLCRWRHTTQ